jgi:hypothetical protein
MSDTKTIKNPSPLVLAVLTLDAHFSDLKRLSERIESLDLKSNFDFEQSEKLINLFAETGEAISADIAHFVNVLNETRGEGEAAAEKVSARADQLKLRRTDIQDKMARFHALSEKVVELNQSLLEFKRPEGEVLLEADKEQLKARLTEVAAQLSGLIDEAQELKDLGHNAKIKDLEQNAEAMRQSLIAVSKKITGMVTLQ